MSGHVIYLVFLYSGVEKESGEVEEKEAGEIESKSLHRTQSIFIRNLAPNITKQEVETVRILTTLCNVYSYSKYLL